MLNFTRRRSLRGYGSRRPLRLGAEALEQRLALAGDFVSALSFGGPGFDHVSDIAIDAQGNHYLTGEFHDTVDFDPSAATATLTSNGGSDVFIAKFDAANNLLWARAIGGSGDELAASLAIGPSGQVYVAGNFTGTVDFDPGGPVQSATSAGSRDAYLLSLTADGDFAWAARLGSTSAEEITDLAYHAGHIYATGTFALTVDFDPGPGVAALTSQGNLDAFFAKFTAAGEFVWAKSFGGSSQERATSIAVSAVGNVVVAGHFRGPVDFDPGPGSFPLTPFGGFDLYASSFDTDGNFQWAVKVGADGSDTVSDLALDSQGNLLLIGSFFETVDFDPGPGNVSRYAGDNSGAYVLKLDSLGKFQWVRVFAGELLDSATGSAIAVDPRDQVFVAGSLFGTVSFGGTDVATFGGNDPYLVKLNGQTGNVTWVRHYGGVAEDLPFALATDRDGHVFAAGFFFSRNDFDPGTAVHHRDSVGSADAYVLKLLDEVPPVAASIVARQIFYNNSAFDGSTPAADPLDDDALATDKQVLLPGQTASFANYTSYSRGINGLMIDIANLTNPDGLSAADFTFRRGNSHNLAQWTAAPAPTQIQVRSGAGEEGSDRVTLIFADGAIRGTWLEVTVRATAQTGLLTADRFYVGNSVGEAGNGTDTLVNGSDFLLTRANSHTFVDPAAITDALDFNRDRLVNGADLLVVRDNTNSLATALLLISPPAGDSLTEGEAVAEGQMVEQLGYLAPVRNHSIAETAEPRPDVNAVSIAVVDDALEKQLALDALFAEWACRNDGASDNKPAIEPVEDDLPNDLLNA